MKLILIAVAALLSLPVAATAAECFYGPFAMYVARQNYAHVSARSGQPCTIGNYLSISERFGAHGARVTQRPQNGTATASGHTITYRSRPGFKGKDTFRFSVLGSLHGRATRVFEAPILVTVTVD